VLLTRGDGVEIAERLGELFAAPQLAGELGAAARDYALRHLNWADKAAGLERFYSGLVAAPRRFARA
jgi:hypothetical protein